MSNDNPQPPIRFPTGRLTALIIFAGCFIVVISVVGIWLVHTVLKTAEQTTIPQVGTGFVADANAPASNGRSIGGVVRNEQGRPIEAARVLLRWRALADPRDPAKGAILKSVGFLTDSLGNWTAIVPETSIAAVTFNVTQKNYAELTPPPPRAAELLDHSAVFVMSDGVKLSGDVVDGAGKPIAGAILTLADPTSPIPPHVQSNTAGKFVFAHLAGGKRLPISAAAAGFAPAALWTDPAAQTEPIHFILTPGRTVSGVVSDNDSKRVPAASVSVAGMDGVALGRTLSVNTDPLGQYKIAHVPLGQISMRADKRGYTGDSHAIDASAGQTNFKIVPLITVQGKVTDAKTHEPIPAFTVVTGVKWPNKTDPDFGSFSQNYRDGVFSDQLGGYLGPIDAWYIRIEAKGYVPVVSSPMTDSSTQNFELQKAGDATNPATQPNK